MVKSLWGTLFSRVLARRLCALTNCFGLPIGGLSFVFSIGHGDHLKKLFGIESPKYQQIIKITSEQIFLEKKLTNNYKNGSTQKNYEINRPDKTRLTKKCGKIRHKLNTPRNRYFSLWDTSLA
jgi:hypothetical protein